MPRPSKPAIEDRIARIVREVDAIEAIRPTTLADYLSPENETLRTALEHRIFLAIQAILDIAAHVIASRGYGVPGTYREALTELGTARIIDESLAESLADAAGLRNAIVHGYLDLDQTLVYTSLWKTDELKAFVAAIWEWAEGQ